MTLSVMSTYAELMLADGDRVMAVGRVVAQDGATWFDPPLIAVLAHRDRIVSGTMLTESGRWRAT